MDLARSQLKTGIGEGAQQVDIDWTTWDLRLALKILCSGSDVQKRCTIRELHVHWWHGTSAAMKSLLEAAGAPTDVITATQLIIDTCKVCRRWSPPGNKTRPLTASAYVSTKLLNSICCLYTIGCSLMFSTRPFIGQSVLIPMTAPVNQSFASTSI